VLCASWDASLDQASTRDLDISSLWRKESRVLQDALDRLVLAWPCHLPLLPEFRKRQGNHASKRRGRPSSWFHYYMASRLEENQLK
jgi:hypothetical protein